MHCEWYGICQVNVGFIVYSEDMLALTIIKYAMFNTSICSCDVGDHDNNISAIDSLKVSFK